MDPNELVNMLCNQLAIYDRRNADLFAWYRFGDKRPGTPNERLQHDADLYAEYRKMFGGRK
jgi:hypothetical protein